MDPAQMLEVAGNLHQVSAHFETLITLLIQAHVLITVHIFVISPCSQ